MMGGAYGASQFADLYRSCVLHAPLMHSAGVSGDIDEFPIIPSGVTVTNNGTFTKTSLGNNRSVLNFDGSTNYISLTDNDAWNLGSGDFTICAWINIVTGATRRFYGQADSSGVNASIYAVINTSNYIGLQLSGNTSPFIGTSPNAVSSGWKFIVFVRSGNVGYVYVNGSVLGTADVTGCTINNSTSPFVIGGTGLYASDRLNSNIKDLMIFKGRALTQPEIKLLMNRTNPDPTNGYGAGAGLMPSSGEYYRLS